MILLLFNLTIIFLLIIKDIYLYNINFSELIQRFGFINIKNNRKYNYLIHGSSCGEILSSKYIIKKLQSNNKKFILTSETPTGYRLIKKYYKNSYLKPYDTILTKIIFFLLNKPEFIIIIESDIWPIFLLFVKLLSIKIISINYKYKFNKSIRNNIHYYLLDNIYLRENNKLLIQNYKKYKYFGNLKLLNINILNNIFNEKYNIFTIISAHFDEIDDHFNIIKYLISKKIKVVYIPRYLNFYDKFKQKFNNFDIFEIEHDNNLHNNLTKKYDICFINCYGIVNSILKYSKYSLMGGTFNDIGGHNIIEPIQNYNYLFMGPNYKTCSDLYKIINQYNIISVCKTFSEFKIFFDKIEKDYNYDYLNNTIKNVNSYNNLLKIKINNILNLQ